MENYFEHLKEEILDKMKEKDIDFKIDFLRLDESDFRRRIVEIFKSVLREKKISLKRHEQEEILSDIISFFLGLGPIDKLLRDPEVNEIMVNGPKQIYVERRGNLELTDVVFRDEGQLLYFIEKIISPLGRRLTEYEPFVDARLKDGSRVNVVRSPASGIGPILTIRKFSYRILTLDKLVSFGTLNHQAAEFLKACVISRLNILISGGAGSGKTTLLNVLGSFIPERERVITIEDTRELHLDRKHTVPLETRSFNIEGKGEITMRHLVKNALHMRPDRIIIGEVRSAEVLDMIQAMNTGQEGSMTTLHANSPFEALERLEILSLMGSTNMSSEICARQIVSSVDLIIQTARFPDGSRKIINIGEVLKTKEYALQDIFVYEEKIGTLKFTGRPPTFYQKLKRMANYVCSEFEKGN